MRHNHTYLSLRITSYRGSAFGVLVRWWVRLVGTGRRKLGMKLTFSPSFAFVHGESHVYELGTMYYTRERRRRRRRRGPRLISSHLILSRYQGRKLEVPGIEYYLIVLYCIVLYCMYYFVN